MSYVRWSSVWPDNHTKNLYNEEPTYTSNWYIFWHSTEKSDSYDATRNDQLLAIWYAGFDNNPVLPYNTVKEMFDTDEWSALGKFDQKEILTSCVQQWIRDVENEFKE